MTRSALLRPAVAACGLLLAAGCGGGEPAAPPLPAIEDAKDVRGLDPCALLPAEQAAQLDLPAAGVATSAPEGPRCEWRGEQGVSLGLTLYAAAGGLATLAENSQPTTTRVRLAGYPALETFTGEGAFCQYDVGVASDQVVLADLTGADPDSCTALQQVLPAILADLPALPA